MGRIVSALDSYQGDARATYRLIAIDGEAEELAYVTLGLVNEAGEVAGKVKKLFRDKDGQISAEDKDMLKSELGDVLWYLTQIATNLGLSLNAIAAANIAKLTSRAERGRIGGDGDNR